MTRRKCLDCQGRGKVAGLAGADMDITCITCEGSGFLPNHATVSHMIYSLRQKFRRKEMMTVEELITLGTYVYPPLYSSSCVDWTDQEAVPLLRALSAALETARMQIQALRSEVLNGAR